MTDQNLHSLSHPTDRTLLEPADDLAVRNLVSRYHHAVFDRDEAAWRETWSEHCQWSLGPDRVAIGIDEAADIWRESLSRYAWIAQLASNGDIRATEDGATGLWMIQEFSETVGGRSVERVARYADRYVRVGETWRFAERRYTEICVK